MTFISSLSLAVILATAALSTPIQQITSSSSSSSPGTIQSQNTFKPYLLESFRTQYIGSRQYIMFIARDQNFGPRAFGRCMSMVSGADGEQYGPETEEEIMWRPVPRKSNTDETSSSANRELDPFPSETPSQAKYAVGDTMDENGWIECTDGFSFKTEGDIANDGNESVQFTLSIKQNLDKENTNGQFSGGELIFTDDITVSCKGVASGSETNVCLPTGDSSFTFGTYEDFQRPQRNVPEDTEADEIEIPDEDEIEIANELEDELADELEDELEDEIEVADEAELELELEAQA